MKLFIILHEEKGYYTGVTRDFVTQRFIPVFTQKSGPLSPKLERYHSRASAEEVRRRLGSKCKLKEIEIS